MTDTIPRRGFYLLATTNQCGRIQTEIYEHLTASGYAPWDGNNLPSCVILVPNGSKAQWFEAGYFIAKGPPLFVVGNAVRLRKKHMEFFRRYGGWWAQVEGAREITSMLREQDIYPTDWDTFALQALLVKR